MGWNWRYHGSPWNMAAAGYGVDVWKGAGLQRNAPLFLCSVRTTEPNWTLHLKNRKFTVLSFKNPAVDLNGLQMYWKGWRFQRGKPNFLFARFVLWSHIEHRIWRTETYTVPSFKNLTVDSNGLQMYWKGWRSQRGKPNFLFGRFGLRSHIEHCIWNAVFNVESQPKPP